MQRRSHRRYTTDHSVVAWLIPIDGTPDGDYLVSEDPRCYSTPLVGWQVEDLLSRGYRFSDR